MNYTHIAKRILYDRATQYMPVSADGIAYHPDNKPFTNRQVELLTEAYQKQLRIMENKLHSQGVIV